MPDTLKLDVKDMDKIEAALDKFPKQIEANMSQAGNEAANSVVLDTVGLRAYPKKGAPKSTPYYVRGVGMQYANYNDHSSENLGKRWTVKRTGADVAIGNSASYAKLVHGDEQPGYLARIGWKKLYETAQSKTREIVAVYQAWVDKTIRDLKL